MKPFVLNQDNNTGWDKRRFTVICMESDTSKQKQYKKKLCGVCPQYNRPILPHPVFNTLNAETILRHCAAIPCPLPSSSFTDWP